ncbi:hypothetical protein C8J56DRAFT_1033863 [Mycena floridula]|nr:hypothetical protein C8J56DRAFT_1033863 [Mycena floridula]
MANGTGVVAWNREADSDPQDFEIVKVKLDENPAETSLSFTVHAAGSASGLLTIPFIRAGIFNMVALDNTIPIATATTFGVIPPNVVLTTVAFLSSTTSVSSMSVSETSVPEPETSTSRSSNTAAVVGAAVGGGIAALMFLITVTIIVRRVTKIKNDHSPAITRTYDIKYVIPSTEKTSLEPNIGSEIMRIQSMSSSTPTERQLELQEHAQDLEGQIKRLQDSSGDVYNEIQRLRNQVSWLRHWVSQMNHLRGTWKSDCWSNNGNLTACRRNVRFCPWYN